MGRIETAMSKIEVEMGDTRRVLHSSVAQMMRGLYDYDVRGLTRWKRSSRLPPENDRIHSCF
jgi:hypothetical protein